MYKIKLVVALRDPNERKRRRGFTPHITGAIVVQKVFNENDTELMGANFASELAETRGDETINKESVWMNDIPFHQMISLVRQKFHSPNINTNANIQITVGTMSEDLIEKELLREKYINTSDETIVRYFTERIKLEPKLRFLFKEN